MASAVFARETGDSIKEQTTIRKIENAFEIGQISKRDKTFLCVQAILAPSALPQEYASPDGEIMKSGTEYLLDALESWDQFSSEQQSLLAQYLDRPSLDTTYISPVGHFAIHYDTIGSSSVPLEDLNSNLIPDYVERAAEYADSAFRAYQNLGYLPVPSDGDSYYDIFLVPLTAYGVTVPESPGDSTWNDYESYMKMHYTFAGFPENDDPEGDVIGAQKVTSAHEYFHAIQLAYNAYQNRWWMEATAVMFEEIIYPEVNDNYNYLNYFFDYPKDRLNEEGTWHQYASFIWVYFLIENFGVDLIEDVFEYGIYYESLAAIDSALSLYGTKIQSVFPNFVLWNYFTDIRSGMGGLYYVDAAAYPLVKDTSVSGLPYSEFHPSDRPDGLGANYVIMHPDPSDDGYVRIFFNGSTNSKWGVVYITYVQEDMNIVFPQMGYLGAKTDFGIYDVALLDSIVIMPSVVSHYLDNNDYGIIADLVQWGDIDNSGAVNVLDIVFLINYKFKGGVHPPYEERIADFDCNGSVNILDIVFLVNYKFKSGPPPGPCRD